MIPDNITKEVILRAITKIDYEGVPKKRESTKYNLLYNNKLYPPKYVISLANVYVNGEKLSHKDFSGGDESNGFLTSIGFEIVSKANRNRAV